MRIAENGAVGRKPTALCTRYCNPPQNRGLRGPAEPDLLAVIRVYSPSTTTSLDPLETKGTASTHVPLAPPLTLPNDPSYYAGRASTLAGTFRHSGWHADRQRIYEALYHTVQSSSRMSSFTACGERSYVFRSIRDPDQYRVMGSACHDRFCVPCQRERAQLLAANISQRLDGQPARFVTFTLTTDGLSLAEALEKLQKSFTRLLKTPLWREKVTGGVAFLEVKYNPVTERWHPHVHAIVQGKYIPHADLKQAWLLVTGDSYIVDIRLVRSQRSILHYVTKYCSKAHRPADFPDFLRLCEAILCLQGRHLSRTFGDWRGTPLTEHNDQAEWECISFLETILHDALAGNADARLILAALPNAVARDFLECPISPPPRPPPPVPDVAAQTFFPFNTFRAFGKQELAGESKLFVLN